MFYTYNSPKTRDRTWLNPSYCQWLFEGHSQWVLWIFGCRNITLQSVHGGSRINWLQLVFQSLICSREQILVVGCVVGGFRGSGSDGIEDVDADVQNTFENIARNSKYPFESLFSAVQYSQKYWWMHCSANQCKGSRSSVGSFCLISKKMGEKAVLRSAWGDFSKKNSTSIWDCTIIIAHIVFSFFCVF